MPHIPAAPEAFDGTLDDLYAEHARHVLIDPATLASFHAGLRAYLAGDDPLFLVRKVKGMKRGETIRLADGCRVCATDNAPAWWIHHQLFVHGAPPPDEFAAFMEAVPTHLFGVRLPESVNSANWHVAHLFDAKDRDVDFRSWDRAQLARRTVRSLHPANYAYVPKPDWRVYGGHPAVLAYFYRRFAARYAAVWTDFLAFADVEPIPPIPEMADLSYVYPKTERATRRSGPPPPACVDCDAWYAYGRLCFKAGVIEPLTMEQSFCVRTPTGTFVLTKREFYAVFPNVVRSASYAERGLYCYSGIPAKALPFRLDTPTDLPE